MRKLYLITAFIFCYSVLIAKEAIDPVITPSLFRYNTEITVVYDVTGTSLANLSEAFAWVWIPGKNTNAKYNVNPASADPNKTNNAKFSKSVVNGKTLFTLTFTPSTFFDGDISMDAKLGILLKGNDWANGQTTDYLATFWDGSFQVNIISPDQQPLFVISGAQITIEAETPVAADYDLFVNDVLTVEQNGVVNFVYVHTANEISGTAIVRLVATQGSNLAESSFQYIISEPSPVQTRPANIMPGINYQADQTKVTLCLLAPGKSSVYVVGDFSNWDVSTSYRMNKDGEFFWVEIGGLTAGEEYAFQYLVDETIFVADPFADKILDPDDQYIPSSVYPSLKSFPVKAVKNEWYFNRLSVFQTNQQEYNWSADVFEKPEKESLVIYELLIRDFFANGERSYSNLRDTINYFKRLGITAVELMPIMEFNGNESWGYNPTFMFAPDKYYGPKDQLKAFIDECHQQGIAVILDIALNHQDIPNSFLMMDFDFDTFKPRVTNKWFNVSATHPFSVFFDMNHESSYTKTYIDTINYYWLKEYKVDGFRFDLSKGFTQTNNPTNVEAWSNYDASRITILKRMADKIWEHSPDAYVILEHLSVNSEEKELAEYRAGEGKGMMLWGKMTDQYNQNTMGYTENSTISGVYHGSRDWQVPRLIGYMESHDEERLMYKNLVYGNSSGTYSVKDTLTALSRLRTASTVFYTIPGPKMLWQFGELGYDYSINHCEDGSNNTDCRISPKPVRWDYRVDASRDLLYQHTRELLGLRKKYDVFSHGDAVISTDNSLVKKIVLRNDPYQDNPALAENMNAVIVANFDLVSRQTSAEFPHSGTWYDFYNGGQELAVTGTTLSMEIPAGGYRIFTDVAVDPSVITGIEENTLEDKIELYPNPIQSTMFIQTKGERIETIRVYNTHGVLVRLPRLSGNAWNADSLVSGFYLVKIQTGKGTFSRKIVKY